MLNFEQGYKSFGRSKSKVAIQDLLLLYLVIHQKLIRVALARAVYARTKYVLLDDPLSAVVSLASPVNG